jgi:hypothetical protein
VVNVGIDASQYAIRVTKSGTFLAWHMLPRSTDNLRFRKIERRGSMIKGAFLSRDVMKTPSPHNHRGGPAAPESMCGAEGRGPGKVVEMLASACPGLVHESRVRVVWAVVNGGSETLSVRRLPFVT